MKNIKYTVMLLLVMMSISSCKKYLTINPKTEMDRDVLFSNESGFKDALTGVYIQMKEEKSYGKAMTMTTLESLISSWDVTANSTEQRLGLFNYTDAGAETALSDIYGQEYKIIASINAILEQIDAKKDIFSPGMYEMIKGECLALRAYCHFDVLRLFGPVPTAPAVGNQLHYVQNLSTKPDAAVSYETFKTLLLKDLADAEALEKEVDPFTKNSILDFKNGVFKTDNNFLNYRYTRMNYYAIKALQARAYLWFNDQQKAYDCARLVIDAKDNDGKPKFRLGTAADMTAKDYVLTCEHIFGLYDFKLFTRYNTIFATGLLKKGNAETTIKTQLYGNTGTDIREANLWELLTISASKSYIYKKYQSIETPANMAVDFKQIPMLRVSEMYLIAIETAPAAEAQVLWNAFRTARNLTPLVIAADPLQRQSDMIKEYRKEFYAEGQAFFAYKRINAAKTSVLFAPAAATVNYLVPMPKTETTIIN
ncbi:RagB/SusD family nutrient uptake outer membrane protein [Pedobacter frigoris]|uniref:RagB/SusD family nutrient uptake outer membrane protein n=1 Tax=Pedobacter frigoris TaxID=2571272 RepID=A0A4U1CNW8_9SPHI|nr:RagB/SusD family nutrient uptake outer membrane protein [Pedobacter frigoris]TKC09153.1 RagB/SusD family nutrient uptake outer membrane protein [Pedobacter frigoris]